MAEIKLTKNAASLLKAIHKAYKDRVKEGINMQEACILGGPSDIQKEIRSRRSLEDIEDACCELDTVGLLQCVYGEDILQIAILTRPGIAYAEEMASSAFRSAINLIKEILPFIQLVP